MNNKTIKSKRILIKCCLLSGLALIVYMFYYISYGFINKLHLEKIITKEKLKNLLLSNFVSYSQHFEDFILFYLLYDIECGFYIDVGANDPNFISVTKAFYDRGWKGINIEPLPFKYKLLKQFRHRDINIQMGAGNMKGNATLQILCDHGECSSIFYNKIYNNSKLLNIKIETMSNICKMYIPIGKEIHFCKIDVEGAEKNVLLGFDFENYRPKIFCIESLINIKTKKPEYKEWEYILTKNDYKLGYVFGLNRFYYDNRINSLKGKFYNIEQYLKKYYKKNIHKNIR